MADKPEHKPLKARKILPDILWAFGRKYDSRAEFSQAVREYQIDIRGEDTWQPDEIVFDKTEIKILLEKDWEIPPDDIAEFHLKSENPQHFTALDLLFSLNNLVADHELFDYVFFEGLSYSDDKDVYFIKLGS